MQIKRTNCADFETQVLAQYIILFAKLKAIECLFIALLLDLSNCHYNATTVNCIGKTGIICVTCLQKKGWTKPYTQQA